jgi:DnaJ like chaperone protein
MWDGASNFTKLLGGGVPSDQIQQRNSFLISLLVLSSAVIRADGKTHPSEIEVVKDFVRRNFGEGAVDEAMRILERLNAQQVNIYEVGPQIALYMNYSQRLQLFHYLVQIAIADGRRTSPGLSPYGYEEPS